ncbi:MAG: LETM1 domain-containing protein, partial [Cyclobacteriaceae bacterium]|nr:LETM1 domain-containing protein [Cyclobacteriaceae bacterium]
EHLLVQILGKKLQFTDEDISSSLLAVESFVLDNWQGMHYLLGKHNMERVSNRFVWRLKSFINKNKDYVVQEIRESKELVALLGKSRKNALTETEKQVVSEQLMDILKTIPTFVIIALPFTFITLPIMLSLLPKSAFPSAFQE